MPYHENILSQEVNSILCSMQELTTLDNELVYAEQRNDDTWKQMIEYLEVTQRVKHKIYQRNINHRSSNYTMVCFIEILK